jgi:hypothetical protein
MASAVSNLEVVKQLVLAELERKALRPTDLLTILGDKYSDVVVKEVVLGLLQEHSIKMTPDQQLDLAERAA